MSAIQRGTTLKVSFGSFSLTGYVPSKVTVTYPDGNKKEIRDVNGAMMTKIFMDPMTKLDCDVVVLSTASIKAPKDGLGVALTLVDGTSTTMMSEGSTADFEAGETRLHFKLVLEDSMAGQYPTT
jgi:hypothetical protein